MVEAYLIKPDESRQAVDNIVSFTINREIGAADDLTIRIAQREQSQLSASRIELLIDGAVEFSGIIDELSFAENGGGSFVLIYARSTAALLLDNEAKPCDYKNADSELIVQNHIAPFGLESVCDDGGEYTDLSVYKGISHWQVIKSFCKRCYEAEPYVDEQGRVVLYENNEENARLYFCNRGGIKYTSATVTEKYYKLISSVSTKASGREDYDVENTNELAQELGVVRKRFADGDIQGNDAACRIIDDGNRQSLCVRLSVPRFVHCPLNCRGAVRLNNGILLDSLRCIKVKISLSERGFESDVTMSGEIGRRE